jgi:hypothetical protein
MKHPTHEELISLVYEEVSTDEKAGLDAHLNSCAACRNQVSAWKETRGSLDAWPAVTHPAKRTFSFGVVSKYAAAAAIVLGIGFLGGRLSTAAGDLRAIRAEMRAVTDQSAAAVRLENAKEIRAIMERLESTLKTAQLQSASDYASLRKELETVAVLTQASLQQAQQQIVQLAGNSPNPKP